MDGHGFPPSTGKEPQDYERIFLEWAGLTLEEAEAGRSRMRLDVAEHHRGGGGTEAVNGGIGAYMFDGLMGAAVRSTWDDDVMGQVTVTMTLHYERPLVAETMVKGRAEVTKRGKRTVFVKAQIEDQRGQVAMTATGVYHLFRRSTG